MSKVTREDIIVAQFAADNDNAERTFPRYLASLRETFVIANAISRGNFKHQVG